MPGAHVSKHWHTGEGCEWMRMDADEEEEEEEEEVMVSVQEGS